MKKLLLIFVFLFSSFTNLHARYNEKLVRYRVIDLQGNTYNAYTPVSINNMEDKLHFAVRINPNPNTWTATYTNMCQLNIATVAAPNTYTPGSAYRSLPPSTANYVNEYVLFNKRGIAYYIYLNLTSTARALIELESKHTTP